MPEEAKTKAGKKYVSEVLVRREWVDYPTLTEEVHYVHVGFRYKDLPPMYFDILKSEYTPEKEDEMVDKMVEAELKRLGRTE
jgi:hypothetical protein